MGQQPQGPGGDHSALPSPKSAVKDTPLAQVAAADARKGQSSQNQPHTHRSRRLAALNECIPLSVRLMSIIVGMLSIGTIVITFSIRWLVSSYLMERVDQQLLEQADLVFPQMLNTDVNTQNGFTSYYVKVYNTNTGSSAVMLQPVLKDGVISSPKLPDNGSLDGYELGVPFTTPAVVNTKNVVGVPDHATMQFAECPWRVVALKGLTKSGKGEFQDLGIVYIGLSLGDQIDVISTLTRFCIMVSIAVVLLGGSLGALVVQRTLSPLKRIEKTAAKIAAGDLSQRVPESGESTEIGSLARSLNSMLTQIERSFHEQEAVTQKMRQFVSDASHELRTPLAAIHGYAELYKMQRDAPGTLERADDAISHIESSSSRMTVLVEDLLS